MFTFVFAFFHSWYIITLRIIHIAEMNGCVFVCFAMPQGFGILVPQADGTQALSD